MSVTASAKQPRSADKFRFSGFANLDPELWGRGVGSLVYLAAAADLFRTDNAKLRRTISPERLGRELWDNLTQRNYTDVHNDGWISLMNIRTDIFDHENLAPALAFFATHTSYAPFSTRVAKLAARLKRHKTNKADE